MSPNLDAMLRSAIEYMKANRKAEARRLLERIVSIDQMHEQAWLWLSACVDTVEEQTICLENVLEINPNNQKARKGLQALQARSSSPAADPFAGSPFTSAPTSDPFADSPFSAPPQPTTPTSVEWGRRTESAPSRSSVPAFSDEDYDAWLASLPLGTPNNVFVGTPSAEAPFRPSTEPLANDQEDFDFGSVYQSASSTAAPTFSETSRTSRTTDPFAGYPSDDLFAADSLDKVLGDEPSFEELQPDLSLYEPPETLDVRPFEQGEDAPLTPDDILSTPEPSPAPALPLVLRPRLVPLSLFGGKKRAQLSAELRHADPSDPFSLIPEEIRARPVLSLQQLRQLPLGVIALVALNLVAVIILIINLTTG
ncbi:MAG: hypothetical protein NZ571_12155 [Anaerolineae bacterium]|nr:hypothetical protein [Anaerolineae bacterium]